MSGYGGQIPVQVVGNYLSGRQAAQDERTQNMRNALAVEDAQWRREDRRSAQQAAQAKLSAEQQKQFATIMTQAAQYGLQQPNPKAFIEQNYPQLAQLAGPNWATADDKKVREELQNAIGIYGPLAGIAPPQPKEPKLITTVGPDGKPVRGEDVVGAPVYERPRTGISFTSPDGTEVQIGGDGVPNYGGTALSKPTRTKLEDAFNNSQANAYALREQLAKYRPEFSTYAGQFKAGVANVKGKLGMENAPQQQQFLQDFTSWKSDTSRLLSAYLNQLSGAAISPHEETRLKAAFPNTDDGPEEYQAKAQATLRSFALAQARAAYLLSNPAQSLDSVSLERMSSIIAGEANRLAEALKRGGMHEEQAKAEAIKRTRAKFGLEGQQ